MFKILNVIFYILIDFEMYSCCFKKRLAKSLFKLLSIEVCG